MNELELDIIDLPRLITTKELKEGKEFNFVTPDDADLRTATASYSDHLKKYCVRFNGELYTFTSISAMRGKLKKLIENWNLKPLNLEI